MQMQGIAFRLISNEREKKTQTLESENSHVSESISYVEKKGFYDLTPKNRPPQNVRARLRDAEKT